MSENYALCADLMSLLNPEWPESDVADVSAILADAWQGEGNYKVAVGWDGIAINSAIVAADTIDELACQLPSCTVYVKGGYDW